MEVLRLVATGATNQQIARRLIISPNTVKVHLRNIFEKLGVQSRTEATMEAVRRGWVPVPEGAAIGATAAGPAAELAPARPVVQPWQRVYMLIMLLLAVAALLAPSWWRARSQASPITPFSDVGQPEAAPILRSDVFRWTSLAPLPEPRSRHALVADAARIYAIGGENQGGITGAVDVYDPQSNGWLPGASKPTPVSNVSAVLLDGRIYVPGGTTTSGGVTNILELYDIGADAWEVRSPLPVPVAGYALAALDGRIYLFGGWDGRTYRADTYVYEPTSDRWSQATPLSEPRAFAAASPLEGVIYLVGGYNGQREFATVEVYDPSGEGTPDGPWSSRTPLAQPRGGLGLTAIGSRLYAVGGGWTVPLAFNEQYDTQTGAWSRFETPVAGQWRNLSLVALNQKLYAIGGWGGGYMATNLAYQAVLRQLLPLGSKG